VDDYCSITVANYGLFRLIKFVSRINTHLSKKFIKRFYLILLNDKILFDVMGLKFRGEETNTPQDGCLFTVPVRFGASDCVETLKRAGDT
jgi:hypothetical protein